MVGYIPEEVLHAYFQDVINKKEPLPIYQRYTVEINGIREQIDAVTSGGDFPDLECAINDNEVPCEVEWLSSHFFQHNHHLHKNYQDFKDRNGFLVVYEQDQRVEDFYQIVVDKDDFKKWFKKNAANLLATSVKKFETAAKKRKAAKLWTVFTSVDMQENLEIAIEAETWGGPRLSQKRRLDQQLNLNYNQLKKMIS